MKVQYNPQIHHRRSIRLEGYDYSQAGAYFITICCQDRKLQFGQIGNGEMILNEFGNIAFDEWAKLPDRFQNFELDVFQIMPNHIHGIIVLNDTVGVTLAVVPDPNNAVVRDPNDTIVPDPNDAVVPDKKAGASPASIVGDIVGAYKSLVANGCLNICKSKNVIMGKLWQRNYYEHIIRDEKSYQRIAEYIINNPSKWNDDKFFLK